MFVKGVESFPWPENLVVDLHDINYGSKLDENELTESVEYVLNEIPDTQLLRLHYQDGKNFKQLSEMTGFSRGVIRNRICGILRTILDTQQFMNIIENGVHSTTLKPTDDLISLGLPLRTYNSLKRAGLNKIYDIKSIDQLLNIHGLGQKGIDTIISSIEKKGYHLQASE